MVVQHLESYLTGARDTSEYIVPEQLPFQASGDHLGGDVARLQEAGEGKGIDESTEDTALQTILSNELQLRNRNSMLTVPGRSFDKVMDILEHVAREELQNVSKMNGGRHGDSGQVVGPRSSGRFQRQTTTDAAVKQLGAQSLGIQSVGFGGMQSNPMVEMQTGEKKREREVKEPARPLVVPRPVKKLAMPTKPKATPLILVPPAASAILNMYNIKEFLENGNFMTSEEAMKRNPKKPAYERCMRSEGRKSPVKYHVTDRDPSRKEDWDRVVAVFCLGKAWQFKKWPFEGAKSGDMVETFLKVAGIHVHYADEPLDPLIKKWNVKIIPISRHSRSQDQAAMRAFWAHLDAFLGARNNSHVAY